MELSHETTLVCLCGHSQNAIHLRLIVCFHFHFRGKAAAATQVNLHLVIIKNNKL